MAQSLQMPLVSITSTLEIEGRELGCDAVFTLSSAKPGNGVEQIRDNNLETYWQSDGAAPHIINIYFMEKKTVSHICLHCDFNLDESYAVKKLCIRSGTTVHDLIDIITVELNEPIGWITLPLFDPIETDKPLRTHLIQIKVLSMHQNGRDAHIRQLKLFGPRVKPIVMANLPLDAFKTKEMFQFCQLR